MNIPAEQVPKGLEERCRWTVGLTDGPGRDEGDVGRPFPKDPGVGRLRFRRPKGLFPFAQGGEASANGWISHAGYEPSASWQGESFST